MFRTALMLGAMAFALSACDLAKDTADTSQGGAQGAGGIAEKMSDGTTGGLDLETGEAAAGSGE
jgi:hypothetical protein